MAKIPKVLQEHINSAFPATPCLVATVLPNGFAQVTPRGSTMAFDDEHIALWERGKGSTTANMKDGTKVTRPGQWPARRAEIQEDFEREVYGRIPANMPKVTWEVTAFPGQEGTP